MSAPTLENIPAEMHLMIVELLSNSDLNNLCKVSKGFYAKIAKYLYKSISLRAFEDRIEEIHGSHFWAPGKKGLLGHARHIKIWAPFHVKTSSRCMHMDRAMYDPYWDEAEEVVEGMVEELKENVLENCKAGAIQSLDWALGTCVPQSLLGPTGYFPSEQQKLETIRLVTDGSCMWKKERRSRLAIGAFPCLKRLSWAGLSSVDDFETLGDVLEKRSHQLEELEIDLTYHRDLPSDYDSDDEDQHTEFAVQILKLHRPTSGRFPVLKRLALAAVPLTAGKSGEVAQRVLKRIGDVFDFSSLQSLKLQHCQGWKDLIILLNRRRETLKLKSLEIQWGFDNEPADPDETILPLLQKIQGLEEFFLYTTGPADPTELWRALLHQRTTLRRFVHHQRSIHLGDEDDEGDALFQLECDLADLAVYDDELLTDGCDSLGKFDLISLGLCCTPPVMRRLVSDFASKTSLQVLHLRQSGRDLRHFSCWAKAAGPDDLPFNFAGMDLPDRFFSGLGSSFVNFAQWAFGPTGIRSLRLLAYGDFSYDGRFAVSTLLLCRREPPRSTQGSGTEDVYQFLRFREVEKGKDRELWELYEREMHVLKACPTDSLFYNNI